MVESVAKLPVKAEKAIELSVRAGSVASVREDITRFIKAASLAAILVVVSATTVFAQRATQLDNAVPEGQAVVTELSVNASAITYWVSASDGWHVVTTVDTVFGLDGDAEKHAVVRFSAVLLPGQSQLISVPGTIGEPQQVLRIRRLGDHIEVVRLPASSV
jgi:hypothetical protein